MKSCPLATMLSSMARRVSIYLDLIIVALLYYFLMILNIDALLSGAVHAASVDSVDGVVGVGVSSYGVDARSGCLEGESEAVVHVSLSSAERHLHLHAVVEQLCSQFVAVYGDGVCVVCRQIHA